MEYDVYVIEVRPYPNYTLHSFNYEDARAEFLAIVEELKSKKLRQEESIKLFGIKNLKKRTLDVKILPKSN